MGKVNVYLPDDLERAVRAAGLSISAVCQSALQSALAKLVQLSNTGQGHFTPRLAAIIDNQRTLRAGQGRDVSALDLLCGILKDGENLGARAVQALGVDLPVPDLPQSREGTGALAPDALEALANAFKIALDMRHDHVGTEHVVIAMAAEAAPAHDIFSVLGITDRLLRQQIERMIANPWTYQHVKSEVQPDAFARLEEEVRRLAAEMGELRRNGPGQGPGPNNA
ncbi:MAG TPA: Clp protease N-terminal domain-containing protein [Actinoplanes sp.]|nr:Clp protease N-terminal domain-containing protein [Actinoplanes sp.]